MNITGILKESLDTLKNNFIIIVPTVVVSIIITILSLLLIGGGIASMPKIDVGEMDNPAAMMDAAGGLMGIALIIVIISMALGTISHGIVIAMAKEAVDTGNTSISSSFNSAIGKIRQLILSAIIVSIIVMIGTLLFCLPGLIAAFLLMFTFIGIIVSNLGALDAIKNSFELVKTNFKDSLVLFLLIIVTGFVFIITSTILSIIPILGQLIGVVIMGLFWGYISIVMVRAYNEMTGQRVNLQSPSALQ